jgi:hypothetical protein
MTKTKMPSKSFMVGQYGSQENRGRAAGADSEAVKIDSLDSEGLNIDPATARASALLAPVPPVADEAMHLAVT